jgi:DNA-directed RNA polymerase specialized sigma24 family protein
MGAIGSFPGSVPVLVDRRRTGRAPWRRDAWTAQEAAVVLQGRRGELVRELARRWDAVGVPAGVREEIVDEAICAVVMMRRPLVSERHLLGAFWVMARVLLARYRQGRRDLRLGSRRRVPLDEVELAAEGLALEEVVELADSAWRAADLMAQLSEIEARVVLVKATRGIGAKAAARELGLPVKDARAATRSARGKLEMVAAIAAAGRMCAYREGAVVAHARGEAFGEQARVARVHLRACASCRVEYRRLRREMRGRDWQRSAAAVFLPVPAAGGGHGGWLERVAGWLSARHFAPRGVGERTAEAAGAAGGVGVVKATAAGTAIIAATATVAGGLHALVIPATHHPTHRHPHPHIAVVRAVAAAPAPVAVSQPVAPPPVLALAAGAASARPSAQVLAARRRAQAGARASRAEREFGPEGEASGSGSGSGPASSEAQAAAPVAHAASVSPSPVESSVGSPSGSSASESSGRSPSAGESQAEREFGPQ